MKVLYGLALFCAIAPAQLFAERLIEETPRNIDNTVPIGGIIWKKSSSDGMRGVILDRQIQQDFVMNQSVNLPKNSGLIIIREKKLKACRQQTISSLGGVSVGGWADCVIDKDGDGRFELVALNEVSGAKPVVPPVPYSRGIIPITGAGSQSFSQTITFLGVSGGDIRLSYREFSNDMARPAFTEDLTLPAPSEFPKTMLVKDIKLTILGIDGSGLRYRLD